MALIIADRVQETTTTTGTGTINLGGAITQYQTFIAAIGNGNQTYYCITSGNGSDWEVGLGTVTSGSPNTLSRTTILASTNANAAINLGGTSTVFCTSPAAALAPNVAVPTQNNTGFTTTVGTATPANAWTGISLTGSGTNICGVSKTAPSTPYSFKAQLVNNKLPSSGTANPSVYYGWYDGTKLHLSNFVWINSATPTVDIERWTNLSTFSSNSDFLRTAVWHQPYWIKLRNDGTNIYFYWSMSGSDEDFNLLYSVAIASGFLANYNSLFFGINGANGGGTMLKLVQGTT